MTGNPNEVAGYVISDLIKTGFSGISVGLGDSFEKLAFDLRTGYEEYFRKLRDRFSNVKTLTHKNKPVAFDSVYVHGRVSSEDETLSDFGFLNALNSGARMVVSGTGGSGKSMLMRYILLQSLAVSSMKRIPIFIELRSISSDDTRSSILEAIQSAVELKNRTTPTDLAKHGLERGAYILILDGFDEIPLDVRSAYEKEILRISRDYEKTPIVVSGRHDDRFASWTAFHIYKVEPLNKNELKLLVAGLSVDPTLKQKFLETVDKSLWKSHSDFLSNPLLATMMVMTFGKFAEIPEKVHVFYHQAFLTLYSMHDASKEFFTRHRISGLPIDVFEKLFSTFCFITYYDNKISFSEIELLNFSQRSIEFEKTEASNVKVLQELVESVCILQKDGLEFVFSHRSFQEYFAALFIYRNQSIDIRKALTKISAKGASEKCIQILYDMNPAMVDKYWSLPILSSMLSMVPNGPKSGKTLDYFKKSKREVIILKTIIGAISLPKFTDFCGLSVLKKLYNEVPPKIGSDIFIVSLNEKSVRDWHEQVVGRTASGRRKPIGNASLDRVLLKNEPQAEAWLEKLGVHNAALVEYEWIKATHERVSEMVLLSTGELENILEM